MDSYADEMRNGGVGTIGMGMLIGQHVGRRRRQGREDRVAAAEARARETALHADELFCGRAHAATAVPSVRQAPARARDVATTAGPAPSSQPNLAPLAPHPQPAQPRAAFMPPLRPSTAEPHPLRAPSMPIVARFTFASRGLSTVTSDEFWTRFNKMAKEEKQTAATAKGSSSAFLCEYLRGAGRLGKWVWCCTSLLLNCIAGGVGAGWYFTHNKPSGPPQAFGGSKNENSLSPKVPVSTAPVTSSMSAGVPAVSAGAGTGATAPVRRRRHRATR